MFTHTHPRNLIGLVSGVTLAFGCSFIEPELGTCQSSSECADLFGIGYECSSDGLCEEPTDTQAVGIVAADTCVQADVPLLTSRSEYIPIRTVDFSDSFNEFGGCVNTPMTGNDGWFRIQLQENDRWNFHLRTLSEGVNPGIFVLPSCDSRSCQTARASDVCDAGTDEHLSIIAPHTGEFFVGVDTREPGGGNFELLALRTECGDGRLDAGEACDDGNRTMGDGCDDFCRAEIYADDTTEVEPNDGSPVANVLMFDGPDGTGTFTVNGRLGERCDRDTFGVDVPEGGSVTATILPAKPEACSPDQPKMRMVLCNPDGNSVRSTGVAEDENSCPELTAEIEGTYDLPANRYFIRVRNSETAPRTDYRIEITVTGPPPV